mmetsp:Transcript_17642/g.35255  ORF Transcript_17642/g.35255 Transcript_17642/m.35255 type:complete len:82 (-) Transcript_17642:553-798(-)
MTIHVVESSKCHKRHTNHSHQVFHAYRASSYVLHTLTLSLSELATTTTTTTSSFDKQEMEAAYLSPFTSDYTPQCWFCASS